MFEAGTKYLSAFCSKSVLPLSASTISNPHSPLFVGIVPSKSPARAANLLAAFFEAGLCLLAPSREAPAFCFDCARRRGAPIPNTHKALATTAAAHRCRTFLVVIFHSRQNRSAKV